MAASTSQLTSSLQKLTLDSETSNFAEVCKSPTFVDKTLMIKNFFQDDFNCWIVSVPSGYGKSTNLDMVKRFVEVDVDPITGKISSFNHSENYKIFKKNNLLIYKEQQFFKRNFGKFPVIYLTFKNVSGKTNELLLKKFAENLSKTFQRHHYLIDSGELTGIDKKPLFRYANLSKCKKMSKGEMIRGVTYLAEMLGKHHKPKKAIVLIDDYDYPVNEVLIDGNPAVTLSTIKFINDIFNSIITNKNLIARSLFVGTAGFQNFAFLQSSGVLLDVYPLCVRCNEYFGLKEDEVYKLLKKFKCCSEDNVKQIIYSYYSYRTLAANRTACTSLVMEYLKKKEFLNYRNMPEVDNMITHYMFHSPIRHLISKILKLGWIEINLISDVQIDKLANKNAPIMTLSDTLIRYLMHYGFFNVVCDGSMLQLSGASAFIYNDLNQFIVDYYGESLNTRIGSCAVMLNNISSIYTYPNTHIFQNLLTNLRDTAILYSQKHPSEKFVSIQCIADVLSLTEFYYTHEIIPRNFPSSLHGSYSHCNAEGRSHVISIFVQYQAPISAVFNEALQQQSEITYESSDTKVFIGISVNENFKFEIEWLFGEDLENIEYACIE